MSLTNSWDESRQQHILQSPFEPHDQSAATLQQYPVGPPQRANRIGPIRTMVSEEFQNHSRSSVSSLSGAMGTASPSQQQPRPSPDHSSNSSPSSDGSNQLHHQRELPLQWDMGLSGASVSSGRAQDILSPGNAHAVFLLEGLDVNRSPYTPSSTLSDLPESHSATFSMSHSSYPSMGRFCPPQRSSSSNGLGQSSSSMTLLYPQSAPADHSGFAEGALGLPMHNAGSPPNAFATTSSSSETEALKQIIRELRAQNEELRSRVEQLQSEATAARFSSITSSADSFGNSTFGLPGAGQIQVPQHLDAAWRRRTEARVKKFCSPNRAGNALCAWHDTRRERRAYPPRMAPPGTLNCGCTFNEALFEESLARHGVGSYLPGDNVRMDPALRNPLLHLLEERYEYRDGDFERDPITGQWPENEGPERWEAELQRGTGKGHRGST